MHVKIEDLGNFPETTVLKTYRKTIIDVMADDGHVTVVIKRRINKQPESPEEKHRRDEAILQLLMSTDMAQNEIAKLFGVSQTYVSRIKSKNLK